MVNPTIRVILSSPLYRKDHRAHFYPELHGDNTVIAMVNKILFKVELGSPVVDIRHWTRDYPCFNDLYKDDGVHLSPVGSHLFARNLIQAIVDNEPFPLPVGSVQVRRLYAVGVWNLAKLGRPGILNLRSSEKGLVLTRVLFALRYEAVEQILASAGVVPYDLFHYVPSITCDYDLKIWVPSVMSVC